MTVDQFAAKLDGLTNDFTNGITNQTQFKHAVQDLLHEVVYNDNDLRQHYYQQFENEAKAWELQTVVSH